MTDRNTIPDRPPADQASDGVDALLTTIDELCRTRRNRHFAHR